MKTPEAFIISLSQPGKAHRFPDLRKSSRKVSNVGARRFGVFLMDAGCTTTLSFLSSHVHRPPTVGTRTPDLYRVKGQLTNTLNNLHDDGDRISTWKYV